MKKFIDDFAQGKIQIKYYLASAKFPRKKRRLISFLTALLSIVLIGLFAKYYDHIGGKASWPIVAFTIVLLIVPNYIAGKWLLQVKAAGKVFFYEEHLEIHQNNEVRSLNYSEIIRIVYCGELPSDLLQARIRSYKTYRVKIFTDIKEHFILHICKEIFIHPEETKHFQKIHPILPQTLKEIKPRYGTLEDSEL